MKSNIPRISRYIAISSAISKSIESGRLLNGMVLTEEPLSKHFNTSRTTIRKALALLNTQEKIIKFNGRGFLVGRDSKLAPVRAKIENILFEQGQSRSGYEAVSTPDQITPILEKTLALALPFGPFRISEHKLAEEYGVSRTVIREVLSRLKSIGLVRKDERSHWILGPLTSRDIKNHYEIRVLLEPCALENSFDKIDKSTIQKFQQRLVDIQSSGGVPTNLEIEQLEADLHEALLSQTTNKRLLNTLKETNLVFAINHMFRESIKNSSGSSIMCKEHLMIFESLMNGDLKAAKLALINHLENSCHRTIQRMKTISILPPPSMPNFLIPDNI